jgi:hypothetical protein
MNRGNSEETTRHNSRGRELLDEAVRIEEFFREHAEELAGIRKTAQEVRVRVRAVDPFIERHSSEVCPRCRKPCCIHRHAYYNLDDLIYLSALGLKPHAYDCREDTEPCQFLSAGGCKLAREVRPSGCNWYFCESLFSRMEETSGDAYKEFDDDLQELAGLWMELISEFRAIFRQSTGYELG